MSDQDEFEAWFLGEKCRHAEAAHKDTVEALARTKTRATSLLGWCVTLSAACLAAASQSNKHRTEAIAGAVGFSLTTFACVRVLYSTPQNPVALLPSDLEKILTPDDPRTEYGVRNAFAEYAEEAIKDNRKHAIADQTWLRRAWFMAAATPAVAISAAGVAWLARWGWP